MANPVVQVRLTPKGIKPVTNGHPWIFRNAIRIDADGGDLPARIAHELSTLRWYHARPALIRDASGVAIGWGVFNASSRLAVRVVSRDTGVAPGREWLVRRLAASVERRRLPIYAGQQALRVVYGEADGVPGLVVDRYGSVAVALFSGAFAWDNRDTIVETIARELSALDREPVTVVMRCDEAMLGREGVDAAEFQGDAPSEQRFTVCENGLRWWVVPEAGQKSGLYCDQRDNRAFVARLSAGRPVLDVFSYHGGFALTCLAAGAPRATCIDSSPHALEGLHANMELQGIEFTDVDTVCGNAFELLRRDEVPGGIDSYGIIVLDPPKLVHRRDGLEAGLRAYKDLNLSVLRAAAPGTRIATFSCSGAVSRSDFRRAVAWAAADAGREVRIEAQLSQPPDHPVPLSFPEAEYLKGLVIALP